MRRRWRGGTCNQGGTVLLSLVLAVLLAASMPGLVRCEEAQGTSHEPITFVFENDLFSGKDRGYTNGVILTLLGSWHGIDEVPADKTDRFTAFVDRLSLVADLGKQRRRPLSFGQMMVTPEDIGAEELIVDDLPYAGLLFGRVDYEYQAGRRGEKFGLLLGIVGPSARAEEVQKIVHEVTNSTEPKGWDNQLHDEAAINVDYEHMWKVYDTATASKDGYGTDLSGYVGVSLGNVITDIDAGIIARWGLHLSQLPNSLYKGGIATVPDVGNDMGSKWSFFLLAGLEINYMAYSVFLDGNYWEEESHSVVRVPEQASVFAGFGLAYQRFRLNMFMLRGTEMYTEQHGRGGYGSLTLGWIF